MKRAHMEVIAAAPLSTNLHRAHQILDAAYARHMKSTGLSPRQFAVLNAVYTNGGPSQTRLVELTHIDRSTLSALVQEMKRRRLVAVKEEPSDLRANVVTLTATGRRKVIAARAARDVAESEVRGLIPENLLAPFAAALQVLAINSKGESA
jgi:DNA-binding MarR family transcriptional regulator